MKKHSWKQTLMVTGILLTARCFTACQNEEGEKASDISYGPKVNVGDGMVQSFVKLDETGQLTAIGFTMSRTALDHLPHGGAHGKTSYLLALPAEKVHTPYDHISLDTPWTCAEGVYNVPSVCASDKN